MAEKLKIGLILNSHRDESLNYALMHSYWFENYSSDISLIVLYMGSNKNYHSIFPILKTLEKFGDIKIRHCPVYEVKYSKIKRILHFLKALSHSTIMLFHCRTIFVAYDFPGSLLNYFYLIKRKNIFALPHTLGLECYAEGIFKTTRKSYYNIPVIAKIPCSSEYFNYLGFNKIICAGVYYYNRQDEYFNDLIKYENKQNYDVIIYVLHSKSEQYTINSWKETFYDIFSALNNVNLNNIGIALHPSQPPSDFELLKDLAARFNFDLVKITEPAIKTIKQSHCFINVMTSAGQIPFAAGKKVCNYGSYLMRKEMLIFGNDPYPYAQFSVEEIEKTQILENWLLLDSVTKSVNHKYFQPIGHADLINLQ